MEIQQQAPRIIGLVPDLTNFTISVWSPIAAIARIMKNLLNSLNGTNTFASTPKFTASVVIIEAITKYKINIGNAFLSENCPPSYSAFFEVKTDNARVIGIIAKVRVNLTVLALSRVWLPSPHILSHVVAAAVTDDVSLIAVPANNPNGPPSTVENPMSLPKDGKIIAANTLKKKITEIDCATSSSSALITGAVAAIAEPPQMDDPTPIKIAYFSSMSKTFCIINATIKATDIVAIIIGKDWIPVCKITFKFNPNPKRTTAAWRTYLDVKLIPSSNLSFLCHTSEINIPNMIAIIGPPITGNIFPNTKDGMAIIKQTITPYEYFEIELNMWYNINFNL